MAQITEPISVHGVAKVLGASTTSVVNLCTSTLINPKSGYKPIRYLYDANGNSIDNDNHPAELGQEEYANSNYGTIIRNYLGGDALVNCWNGVIKSIKDPTYTADTDKDPESMAYYYEKPRQGEDMCRLTDFNGYDSEAGDWAELVVTKSGTSTENATMQLFLQQALSSLNDLQSWEAYSNIFDNTTNEVQAGFGLLVSNSNEEKTSGNLYLMYLTDIELADDMMSVQSPIFEGISVPGELSGDTWYIYPVLLGGNVSKFSDNKLYYNSDFDSEDITIIPLPFGSLAQWEAGSGAGNSVAPKSVIVSVIQVGDTNKEDATDTNYGYMYGAVLVENGDRAYFKQLYLKVTNNYSNALDVTVKVYAGTSATGSFIMSASGTVEQGETVIMGKRYLDSGSIETDLQDTSRIIGNMLYSPNYDIEHLPLFITIVAKNYDGSATASGSVEAKTADVWWDENFSGYNPK